MMREWFLDARRMHRWLWPFLLAALLLAAAATMWFGARGEAAALRSERLRQDGLRAELARTSRSAAPSCAAEVQYAQGLPASMSIDKLVQSLQDSTMAFGVTLQSVASNPHPATPRTLGLMEVNLSLRGGYAPLKSALAEALSRYPSAVVTHLRIKRASLTPLAEEAEVDLLLPLRPQMALLDCRLDPQRSADGEQAPHSLLPASAS